MNTAEKKFLIDANVFIQASRRHYRFEFARPFWNALATFGEQNKILSIDKVFQEIKEGDDELLEWAKNEFTWYFDTINTAAIHKKYAELIQWAEMQPQYKRMAKDEFMEETNADAWVVAYAIVNNCIVVTEEVLAEKAKKRIPILNVCKEFDVEHYDTFDMLSKLKFSF